MRGSKTAILVDTNIIIESVRTACWNGIRGYYDIVTVEKCREEARSGGGRSPDYVVVDDRHLTNIQIENVTDDDRARLVILCSDAAMLDDGERELFAHASSRTGDWKIVFADQAAIRIAMQLVWRDRLISLEELAAVAGLRSSVVLKRHYTTRWLSECCARFLLDDLGSS